jgi:transposase
MIARRGNDHGSGLGAQRWVIERTFAWLHNFRRLRTRYQRDGGLHVAFMQLGCAVTCHRVLRWQTDCRLDVKVPR